MKTFSNILICSARRLASMTSFALTLLACSALSSCSDDSDIIPSQPDKEGCFITVNVPMQSSSSRAGEVDPLNEFTVKTLDLFFYPTENFTSTTAASYYKHIDLDPPIVITGQVPVNIPKNLMNDIFGNTGTKCYLYAVANYADIKSQTYSPSQLMQLPLGSKDKDKGDFIETKVQESFAMISDQATVELDRNKNTATGSITLTRACAKLMLSLNIPPEISVNNITTDPGNGGEQTTTQVTYRSNAAAARVWISNGVKSSILFQNNPTSASQDYYTNEFVTTGNSGSGFSAASGDYNRVQSIPFYSYPNKWDPKSAEGMTIITFQIPWQEVKADGSTSEQFPTYYSITVNPDKCELLRNYCYDMRLKVSRLGSVNIKEPINMNVEWNYQIPWNEANLPTDIKDIRYLLLNNNDYDATSNFPVIKDNNEYDAASGWYVYQMNNETDISIPVSTSHNVEIYRVEMIWRDFKNNVNRFTTVTPGKGTIQYDTCDGYNGTNGTKGTAFLGLEFDNTTSTLKLSRDLYNIEWNDDKKVWNQNLGTYTPMYINVYIRHKDNHNYTQKIRIEQYPPIYISADVTKRDDDNKITRFVDNKYEGNNDGYIYCSNYNSLSLGSLHDDNHASFKNPQTYVISISKLDTTEAKTYIIADPRVTTINNLPYNNINWSAQVNDINGTLRRLSYYYPADDASEKQRYIAPKFRIASQWGITFQLSQDGAIRRCASYQENGRPAGRWRVPTPAEIEFIATLSNKGFIPYLFGVGGDNVSYWCSTGGISISNTNNPSVTVDATVTGNRAVRCVYDEWYWGNDTLVESQKATFVWGDRQRSTSGNVYNSIKR